MDAREVLRRARAEHASIEQRLGRLETLASRILGGPVHGSLRELEESLAALRVELLGHLSWEDAEGPEVRGVRAEGGDDVSWLRSTHDELRDVLDFCRHACGDESHPVLLARRVGDLVELLRRSLAVEDRWLSGSSADRRSLEGAGMVGASGMREGSSDS